MENSSLQPLGHIPEITEIMNRLFEVQNNGKATVFIEVSGHVQQLHVRMCIPYWMPDIDYSYDDYVNMEGSVTDFKNRLFAYLETL